RVVTIGDLELPALVLDLTEETRVLNGHRRLGGEGLEEPDDLRRELTGRLSVDVEPADQMALAKQRHAQERSAARPQQNIAKRSIIGAGRGDVGDLNRLAGHGHAPGDTFATADRHVPG